ncbi:MAG: EamA family transporter [Aulosira sp. ZfuVER01]|nr:EamA family transporter [Aulosira sp. ZfuVER01]MDZ8000780.1 EamA family transporter [Aulosira sp. DedVER01a]MDZ8055089.1 EamA family transporter [Aulosira sp. ZfuCHP01]
MFGKIQDLHIKFLLYTALFGGIVFGITSQLLMKWAMLNASAGLFSWSFIWKLAIALATYVIGVVSWIFALRFVNLSIAYPLSSLNYIGIFWGSHYFFNEQIRTIQLLGVLLVFMGILLVVIPWRL